MGTAVGTRMVGIRGGMVVLLILTGCEGAVSDAGGSQAPEDPDGPEIPEDISECRKPNAEIYTGLHGSCVGCHDEEHNRPFFASLEAFERQIAYSAIDPLPGEQVFVVPGQPEASELLRLLDGSSETLGQMPPGVKSYAELAADNEAPNGVSMARVQDWVRSLEICELPAPPPIVHARRLPAELIRSELLRQLDLTDADVDGSGRPLGSPDDSPQRVGRQRETTAHDAWQDLGGAHILDGRRTSLEVAEAMVQTLVPLSQAWCSISVENKSILLRHATKDADSVTNEAAIKANIAYLFLHMLGEVASDDDVNAMFDTVYRPTEQSTGGAAGWTAVCATLVRDPLWLTY
ncbi:MAG: hypothetical protein AAGF12_08910 [Myxococcota bacterium]